MGAFLASLRPASAGRFWAYVGTLLGIGISAMANHAESLHYAPEWMAVGMGTVPIFLFISLEVLVRNRMKEHLAWWRGGLITVAAASGITSYAHMALLVYRHTAGSEVVEYQSLTWFILLALALIVPVVPDGTMLLSTLALLFDPNKVTNESDGRPASRYDYIVAIPDLPMVTRTIVLPSTKPIVVEKAEPVSTVTMSVRKPKRATTKRPSKGVRFNRPEDHPLFAEWAKAEGTAGAWSDEEFAARSGKSVGASRAQAGRWRAHLEKNPRVNGHQYELIGS